MTLIVALEGLIGAGKTQLMNEISKQIGDRHWEFVTEKVEDWKSLNLDGKEFNMLDAYYKNKIEAALALQVTIQCSRTKALLTAKEKNPQVIIVERGMGTGHEVFAKIIEDLKPYDKAASAEFNKFVDAVFGQDLKEDAIIFTKRSVEGCLKNIKSRNRAEEVEVVDKSYLDRLQLQYEKYLKETKVKVTEFDMDCIADMRKLADDIISMLDKDIVDNLIRSGTGLSQCAGIGNSMVNDSICENPQKETPQVTDHNSEMKVFEGGCDEMEKGRYW